MNMLGLDKDAKIERVTPGCFSNNIIYKDPKTRSREFKSIYANAMDNRGIDQDTEGAAIDRSQSTIAQYIKPLGFYDFPAFQVPYSIVADELFDYLASIRGGHYTPPVSGLNGSIRDEISAILHSCSQIIRHAEKKEKVSAELEKIFTMAQRASEEMKK